jgi:multiple sugar transport system substrate-binding protein
LRGAPSTLPVLMGLGTVAAARLLTLPASLWEWDEVLFVRGVERFEPLQHHPHPPGYPLLIGLGKLFALVTGDPFRGLVALSVVASLVGYLALFDAYRRLAAPPGAGAMERAAAERAAVLGAALFQLSPAMLVYGPLALSDAPALAFLALALAAAARLAGMPVRTGPPPGLPPVPTLPLPGGRDPSIGRLRPTLVALALLALPALAACGRGEAHSGRTTVRFWAFGREGEVVRELVPEFERRHPAIRVEVQQIPWTAAHEKLLTAYVGNAIPDVAQIGNTWIPELVALGALAPLDERLAGSRAVDRADSFAGIWDSNVLKGATWGVPWYVDTRLLFYRTDLVAAAGGPWPPRSWAEWRETMVRLKRLGGPGRFAILLPIDEWTQPVIFGLQAGAGLLADGGRRGAFRDPRFRRAMAFYLGLYEEKLAPALDLSGVANQYQQLAEGYFAMIVTGPWNLGEFRHRLPPEMQDRWATAPLPPPDAKAGYPGASLAGGSSLVLFHGAREPEAAWQWIEYLSEPAQQARFYDLSGDLPARRAAWRSAGLAGDPKAAPFLEQLQRTVSPPKVPEWEQIATRIAEAAEQVMRGGRDLDSALAALDKDVDRILEKRRWLLDREAERKR